MLIIDPQKIQDLYGSIDIAQDIINLYIEKSPELILNVEQALLTNNQHHIEQVCHKGIGQARYIGSELIENTLQNIQNAPMIEKDSHLDTLKDLIQQLKHEQS